MDVLNVVVAFEVAAVMFIRVLIFEQIVLITLLIVNKIVQEFVVNSLILMIVEYVIQIMQMIVFKIVQLFGVDLLLRIVLELVVDLL